MALQPGQTFGNFNIIRLIGEGGFGEVYLAENPLIERRAAVKVLHPSMAQNAELVRRFLNEARAASAIHHPSIVQVFDAGVTPEGAPYILMEFLEGQSLQKCLADGGRLDLPRALAIASQAGSALSAAHAAGIVHRDLKPENLFLVPDEKAPAGQLVKILDFGIAKMKAGTGLGGTLRTQTGAIMGSPAYMSPEQCKDSADVDLRTDIYSFATILYEMLVGRTPYVASSGTEFLVMHLTATPQPLRELIPGVPDHVEAAIMRGLARERENRFASMAAFIGTLTSAVAAPAPARSLPTEILSATGQEPALHVQRTAALPARTTFSRATGEVGVEASDEALLAAARSQRRMPFVVGGVALVGLAIFLLLRPGHVSAPRATASTTSDTTVAAPVSGSGAPAAVVVPEKLEPIAPVAPSIKADAKVSPPALEGKPSATKEARATARRTGSLPTTKKGRSEERWLAH